jgi:DNA-binding MarR family transcriptional regulator
MPDPLLVDAVERLMRAAVGITTRSLSEAGAPADLTLQQWRTLAVTAEAGAGGVRVGEIGWRLGVAIPGASRLVARLDRRGLVAVSRDAADRRAAIVRLTDGGRTLWEEVVERRRAHITEVLAESDAAAAIGAAGLVEALGRAFAGLA